MLVLLGILNLRVAMRSLRVDPVLAAEAHEHAHRHGDYVHTHAHGHELGNHGHSEDSVPPARLDRIFGRLKWYGAIRPIVIGIVHGFAGSAAVALLVLPIIQRPTWALAYLIVFGLGTIMGMVLMTATIAVPIAYTARFNFLNRHFGTAAGVLSLGFGLFLAYQIGFVDGLFTH
jgi:high-affinity nickel-transport protein